MMHGGSIRAALPLIVPYAAWMVLMTCLPATAAAYAVRGVVTAVLLVLLPRFFGSSRLQEPPHSCLSVGLSGLLIGLLVFVIWIGPDLLGLDISLAGIQILGSASVPDAPASPYAPNVCGWTLTLTKLAASAFVIPLAEELFFRKWLVEFAGFGWMVALFAVEHGERWVVGALTGLAYGLLARRFGIRAAILAHMVTNLILGLYVIFFDKWFYW